MTGSALRPIRFDGERLQSRLLDRSPTEPWDAFVARARDALEDEGVPLTVFLLNGAAEEGESSRMLDALGAHPLGESPLLVRTLRSSLAPRLPLVLPWGGRRRSGVREIAVGDPRLTRLWDRFSIDVLASVERSAAWIGTRVFDERGAPRDGYRIFIFEDGDRYVIRALCIFRPNAGEIAELLHDRSVAGMRAASHLLGLVLRELVHQGAERAIAWSLVHSGSYPLFVRHAFLPSKVGAAETRLYVHAQDPALEAIVRRRDAWYLSLLDRLDGSNLRSNP